MGNGSKGKPPVAFWNTSSVARWNTSRSEGTYGNVQGVGTWENNISLTSLRDGAPCDYAKLPTI